jgi:hypothetical protein
MRRRWAACFIAAATKRRTRRRNAGWTARPTLNLITPLDFVSTCDIGGGDYGSPTVNRAGELVGVIFDGNLESLPNTYLYVEEQARAVHVAVQGIAEALEKVYQSDAAAAGVGGGGGGRAVGHRR